MAGALPPLPPAVENLIILVQVRHEQNVSPGARVYLRNVGEENAVRILSVIERTNVVHNLSGMIVDLVKRSNLECASPLTPRGRELGENLNRLGAFRVGDSGVHEEEAPVRGKCGLSDHGLSDEALLAIDIEGAPPFLRKCPENGVWWEGNVGECTTWGEATPGLALEQQYTPLVPSQGSNELTPCYYLDRGTKPEPDHTPSSHSAEASSSRKRRSSGSVEDASSGTSEHGREQKILPDHEFFNQTKCPALPVSLNCGSPALVRRMLTDSEFTDARKLDFGVDPIFPLSHEPQSSQVMDPIPQENIVPKECVFRHKDCALLHRSELSDPATAHAFGELSFTKRFLVLDHCKEGQRFPSVKELEVFKSLGVEEVDNRLFHVFSHPDHIAVRDWSKRGNGILVFTCNVSHSGKYEFAGPRFENGGTPLQRAFGEENVLIVKFEDTTKNNHTILDRYRCVARHGILCGLKKFFFYAFKDGESKKKQGVSKKNTYGCKSVFVAIESSASADNEDNMKKFDSIAKARNYLMHPTVPTLAKAISRLQLALSITTQIPLNSDEVHVEQIDDIPCLDENGNEVRDANGKLLIHTDGCGYISKNLAKLCQDVVIKGIKQPDSKTDSKEKQEYPLMMQVRLFWKGNVWKGVLVVNLNLPDNTIQVRPSMLKVERDDNLHSATFNSLELCNTSRKPSDAKLFQHLLLLLTLGGVKEETLLKFVEASIEKLRNYFTSSKEAFRVALRNIDSHHSGLLACEMIMSGLEPSQEPFLQKVISEMVKFDFKNYSLGKVPVPDTAYLMGCADPTGLLKRNQVAILVGNGNRICREKVLVYKPPGLHPGDVHIFEATWIKELETFVGTGTYGIIFSTKGARSVTDEMAGSDLDGDQYWVSWNSELVDSFNPSPPWEAPNVLDDKKPLPRPTIEEDFETQHFEKFIQIRFDPSVIKGRAANAWLALTDCSMSSNVDETAQRHANEHISPLVNLFYESLDAEKSGKEVRWPNQLQINLFPHFLEKNKDEVGQDPSKLWTASNWIGGSGRKPTKNYDEYKSTSILGKIYDFVKKEDFDKALNVDVDKVYEYDGYEEYYGDWCRHFYDYGRRTATALQAVKLGSSNEQEFRTCVYDKLLAEYKKIFFGEGKSNERLLKEASAIYTAVYGKAVIKESQALQFAWKIAGSQLCKIRAEKSGGYICFATANLEFFLRH